MNLTSSAQHFNAKILLPRRNVSFAMLIALGTSITAASAQQPSFAVATIRPSAAEVKFERDGETDTTPGTLRMRDVTLDTCIKWAYNVQESQVSGPDWIRTQHFDITAKADEPATDAVMKQMLQTLLVERFKLSFHRQPKEMKAFALTQLKTGHKMHPSESDGPASHQNSANGMVSRAMSMQEFADYIAGPLQTPVVDNTQLPGRYNFTIDFTPYLSTDMRSMRGDATSVLMIALQGELGLKLDSRKIPIEVLIIDHAERPSQN